MSAAQYTRYTRFAIAVLCGGVLNNLHADRHMSKHILNKPHIPTTFITPAGVAAGWYVQTQTRHTYTLRARLLGSTHHHLLAA